MARRHRIDSLFLSFIFVSCIAVITHTEAFLQTSTSTFLTASTASFDSSSSTSTSLQSSVPKSKNKNKNKQRKSGTGQSLTWDELSDHLSARYSTGRGRAVDEKVMKRGIFTGNDNGNTQAEIIKKLNESPALLLNADYQPLSYMPLSLWSWQDAIKAIFSGKVQVVDVYPDVMIRGASLEVPLPSVIALTEYVSHVNNRPAFTRRNVFLRDGYKCQYCAQRFHTADLSLDHVVPRCMGGQLNWENAVTCCKPCNVKKGSTPLSELRRVGMKLVQEPRVPTQRELAARVARMVPRRVHPTWKPFMGISTNPTTSSNSNQTGDEQFIDDRYFEGED